MKFNHIAIQTKDFDESLNFYKNLGFEIEKKIVDQEISKIYLLTGNGVSLELFSQNINSFISSDEIICKTGYIHICFF